MIIIIKGRYIMEKQLNQLDSFDMNVDYRVLCEYLIRGNLECAITEFDVLTFDWIDSNNLVAYRVFLNSLNSALYYYALFNYKKSLIRCYMQCTLMMHKPISKTNFRDTAVHIINDYYNAMLKANIIVIDPFLKSVMKYIDDNISNPITLEDTAKEMFVNKSYLSHIFKQKTGLTFSVYVTNRKLNYARELLINTDLSVVAISNRCGYRNPTYFSTVFSKYLGLSPAKFRKNSSNFKKTTESDPDEKTHSGGHPGHIKKI